MISPNTKEWYLTRSEYITSSVCDVLRVNGKREDGLGAAAVSLCHEKAHGLASGYIKDVSYLPAIQWGEAHEPEAITYFELEYDVDVTPVGLLVDINNKFAGTPDGYIDSINAIIEVKCPENSDNHMRYFHGYDVPNDYRGQIQGNIHLCKADLGIFISYDPRQSGAFRMFTKVFYKDEEYLNNILSKAPAAHDLIIETRDQIIENASINAFETKKVIRELSGNLLKIIK